MDFLDVKTMKFFPPNSEDSSVLVKSFLTPALSIVDNYESSCYLAYFLHEKKIHKCYLQIPQRPVLIALAIFVIIHLFMFLETYHFKSMLIRSKPEINYVFFLISLCNYTFQIFIVVLMY